MTRAQPLVAPSSVTEGAERARPAQVDICRREFSGVSLSGARGRERLKDLAYLISSSLAVIGEKGAR